MKILFHQFHGLGDAILLTPVLRKYKEEYPETFIGLTHLKRLPTQELFSECPYIDEFFPISDAWNDFGDFNIGKSKVYIEALAYAEDNNYDKLQEITMNRQIAIHKIHRAARELGVRITDYRTKIFPNITEEIKRKADEFLKNVREPYTFIHTKTGNSPKDVGKNIITNFIRGVDTYSLIEYHSNDLGVCHLPIGNIPLEMEILSRCNKVICADSFIFHAAGALEKEMICLYRHAPIEWVLPLHYQNFRLIKIK